MVHKISASAQPPRCAGSLNLLSPDYTPNLHRGYGDSQSTIRFSILTATKGSTQKRLIPGPDGQPIKDPNHDLGIYAGQVEPVEVDSLAAFAEALAGLKSNQALTLGVTGSTGPQALVTKRKLAAMGDQGGRVVSRSLEFFSWPEGYFASLFDHDPEPGKPDLTDDQLWARFCGIMPEFGAAGRVVTVSSSSGIYDKTTGECLKPASGHHTFVIVKGNVDRFKTILEARCWLHGEAFYKLGTPNKQTGTASALERFLVDGAVFSPERLVYESGAEIDPSATFEQRQPAPKVVSGDYIDLDSIPDLTPAETAQAAANRKQALDAIKPQRIEVAAAHVANEQPDLPQAEVRRVARQRVRECDRGELLPGHTLYLAGGSTITAGDIGPEHHEVKLRDPQEPDYRGGAINSIIYFNDRGGWRIHSQAHGGKNYTLAATAAPQGTDRPLRVTFIPPAVKGTDNPDDTQKPESGATRRDREKWQALEREYGLDLLFDEFEDQYTEAQALAEIERIKDGIQAIYEPGQVKPDRIITNGQDGFSQDDLVALLQAGSPIVGTGNTGCGKTQLAADLDSYMGHPSLVGAASTQNLSIGQAKRLGGDSTADTSKRIDYRRVSMPAESIYKIGSNRVPDVFVVDEPDAQLPRVLEGSLGDAQDANLTTFKRLAQSVDHQLWLNANISPITIDAIEHLSGKRPHIVEIQRDYGAGFHPERVKVQIYADDPLTGDSGKYPWLGAFMAAAKAGKNLLVQEPSVQNAKAFQRMLRARGIGATLVDGSFTPIDQRRGFAANPDLKCGQRQITIMTRIAETGTDIQAIYDAVFARVSPNQTSEQGYQFLSRPRRLLTGEIPELHLHLPALNFTSVEQLSVNWHLERISAANAYRVEILREAADQNKGQLGAVQQAIADLNQEFTLLARFKAEAAAQRLFRDSYLINRLEQVGFSLPNTATTGDPDSTDRWETQLTRHKRQNDKTKAACIARGQRLFSAYPEAYQDKIDDIREQGFILGCKRKKLDLSARFPLSPLENPEWILSQILDNERAEPQSLVLGVLMLANNPDAYAALHRHRGHLADSAIAIGQQYGPLSMIRKMSSRVDLAALDLGAVLSQSALIMAAGNGTLGAFCKADPEVQELATLLRANKDRLSLFCRLYLGQDMSWDEKSDTALVCKALNKILGLSTAKTTQKRVNGKPCHFYELGNTDAAIAVRVAKIVDTSEGKADSTEVKARLLEAWGLHWSMAQSASEGWRQAAEATREATADRDSSPCHTKLKATDHSLEFSVTPPPPDIPPGDWADLKTMVKWAQAAGEAALTDLKDTLTGQIGPQLWEVLSHAA